MKALDDKGKQMLKSFWARPSHIYFIGIGGVGMSALAKVLVHFGHRVSGSDAKQSPYLDSLIEKGVKITLNQKEPDLEGIDFAVYSSAIPDSHPEWQEARRKNIPLFHRAHLLSFILNQYHSIAITGTHGKTTTSAMISYLLKELGASPTCLVGSKMRNVGDNVILGSQDLFVAEVDESDGTQDFYHPSHLVMTNLDDDHMDYYQNLENLESSFKKLAAKTQTSGWVVYSFEDERLRNMMRETARQKLSYGFSREADFYAEMVCQEGFETFYRLFHRGRLLSEITLSVPGRHNVMNSLASLALLYTLGFDLGKMRDIIKNFQGTSRRLEVKYRSPRLWVIDDYAHHPTEVEASLAAMKRLGRKMCVVFQPHRFSRTRHLAKSFGPAFQLADQLILTDIYSAGETSAAGVDAQLIFQEVKAHEHPNVQFLPKNEIIDFLMQDENRYELIAFLGAGDIGELADDFTGRIED